MSTEKLRGIVIREIPVGESDKIITLLTQEKGKVTLSARGARKTSSKYLSCCELFACSDIVAYVARKNPALSSAVLIDNFYGLRTDIKKFAAAAYMCDLCDKTIFENADCREHLKLLTLCLKDIERGIHDPLFDVLVFELKFMSDEGLLPQFGVCGRCGGKIGSVGFLSEEGALCDRCGEGEPISAGALKALCYIESSSVGRVLSFGVSREVLAELMRIRNLLFSRQIDIKLKTYDFLMGLYKV